MFVRSHNLCHREFQKGFFCKFVMERSPETSRWSGGKQPQEVITPQEIEETHNQTHLKVEERLDVEGIYL